MTNRDLETYRKKRDFKRTSEPAGKSRGATGNMFMVHKHDATRLHYDLRLQIGDVLKSWAVPKGPSLDPAERRLAVEVENHPLEYGDFEGVIPDGQYGAGPTLIWDRGTWAPMGDISASLKSGTLKFRLAGEKLKGGWTLARLRRRPGDTKDNWLLIKERDDAAATDFDILEERPESVKSGKRIEELLAPGTEQWTTGKKALRQSKPKLQPQPEPKKPVELRPGALKGARKAPLPKSFRPQLASPVDVPPNGKDWLHEIKLDGYRTVAIVSDGTTKLLTRNGHDWTDRYGDVAAAFNALPAKDAIIDGEVVVPDAEGRTRFGALQDAIANGDTSKMVFYAFDLPYLNGFDLSAVPLRQRKSMLERLLSAAVHDSSPIQLSEHVVGNGAAFFDSVSEMGLEGVVSKRADSVYQAGDRTRTWLKSKAKRIETLTVVGYTTSRQAGGLAALLLADNDGGELRYVGKVGTGFSTQEAASLLDRLAAIGRAKLSVRSSVPTPKDARWVEPSLKVKVQYSDRSADQQIRHAVYRGLLEPERSTPPRRAPAATKRYITDEHLASIWVTNPDRRMFSPDGPTKLDLAVYYAQVGDAALPHLLNRPVSLVRCPSGRIEDCFFQRHAFTGMPPEVGTFELKRSDEEDRTYIYVKDAAGFLALAQFGVVEFHPWGCLAQKPELPDRMFFDLDPGEGVAWRDVKAAAQEVRNALTALGLAPFVKTSGKKGIHVVVPIKPKIGWKELHAASGKIAAGIALRYPKTFTTNMAKNQRHRRIFLDFHRNARSATAVGAYSLRAVKGLPASTPVAWDDLPSIDSPADLNYATVPGFLRNANDPWADMDARAVVLDTALARVAE